MYPCPCCGYEVFGEPPGLHDICPICYWEDDIVQLAFPDLAGGANHCSLIEGQSAFAQSGACEEQFKENVRAPLDSDTRHTTWCALDSERDRYLKCDSQSDREKWQAAKDSQLPCLYYWSSRYWLTQSEAEQTDERAPE